MAKWKERAVLLFKEEGTGKVIEYIRSIRPDIELTWYQTPL